MTQISNFKFSFAAASYVKENSNKDSNFIINLTRILLQKFFLHMISKHGFFWLYIYNPFLLSSSIIEKKVLGKYKFNIDPNIREDLAYWLVVFAKYKNSFIYHPKILLTITRANNSLTSNKIEEFNKIINSISQNFFINKNYKKFNFFLIGIALKVIKLLLSRVYKVIRKKLTYISIITCVAYFFIFYSPIFWMIGNNLIFYNTQKKTEEVFILSGHQGFDYWNNSYQERFFDVKNYVNNYNARNDTKFFLLGKLQAIPEQKIIEALMIGENIERSNIKVIYKEYQNSVAALNLLKEAYEACLK
jgi:hypothetical protein